MFCTCRIIEGYGGVLKELRSLFSAGAAAAHPVLLLPKF
jgi:hypothetical protein